MDSGEQLKTLTSHELIGPNDRFGLKVQQSDIDYFRSEMLEQKNSATAIKDIQKENNMSKDELLYDMGGRRVEVIKKGHLYIIKNRHGHTRKVFY